MTVKSTAIRDADGVQYGISNTRPDNQGPIVRNGDGSGYIVLDGLDDVCNRFAINSHCKLPSGIRDHMVDRFSDHLADLYLQTDADGGILADIIGTAFVKVYSAHFGGCTAEDDFTGILAWMADLVSEYLEKISEVYEDIQECIRPTRAEIVSMLEHAEELGLDDMEILNLLEDLDEIDNPDEDDSDDCDDDFDDDEDDLNDDDSGHLGLDRHGDRHAMDPEDSVRGCRRRFDLHVEDCCGYHGDLAEGRSGSDDDENHDYDRLVLEVLEDLDTLRFGDGPVSEENLDEDGGFTEDTGLEDFMAFVLSLDSDGLRDVADVLKSLDGEEVDDLIAILKAMGSMDAGGIGLLSAFLEYLHPMEDVPGIRDGGVYHVQ